MHIFYISLPPQHYRYTLVVIGAMDRILPLLYSSSFKLIKCALNRMSVFNVTFSIDISDRLLCKPFISFTEVLRSISNEPRRYHYSAVLLASFCLIYDFFFSGKILMLPIFDQFIMMVSEK